MTLLELVLIYLNKLCLLFSEVDGKWICLSKFPKLMTTLTGSELGLLAAGPERIELNFSRNSMPSFISMIGVWTMLTFLSSFGSFAFHRYTTWSPVCSKPLSMQWNTKNYGTQEGTLILLFHNITIMTSMFTYYIITTCDQILSEDPSRMSYSCHLYLCPSTPWQPREAWLLLECPLAQLQTPVLRSRSWCSCLVQSIRFS